jgi:hypothetical protein
MDEIISAITGHFQLKELSIIYIFQSKPVVVKFEDKLCLIRLPEHLYSSIKEGYLNKYVTTMLDKLVLKHSLGRLHEKNYPTIYVDYAEPNLFEIITNF